MVSRAGVLGGSGLRDAPWDGITCDPGSDVLARLAQSLGAWMSGSYQFGV